ncbi:MAG: FkbM family methyltransferase, partial [Gemmatimonadales bacterium]
GETVDVQTVVLDQFWKAQGLEERMPRFIKMDIEGFELMALRGASGVLRRCPLVMLEYSPSYMKAASIVPGDLIDLMLGHGFSPNVLSDGKLVPRDTDALKQTDAHVDLFWTR